MNAKDPAPAPGKTLTEIQLALARVAFRLAQTTEIIAGQISRSKSNLLAEPDPQTTFQELTRISTEMMDVAGDLLGIEGDDE